MHSCFISLCLLSLSDNDVDGETVDCGLTETMVAYLFKGYFKKQAKFNQFVCKLKETVVTLTLEPVPPEECQFSYTKVSSECMMFSKHLLSFILALVTNLKLKNTSTITFVLVIIVVIAVNIWGRRCFF